ncbi:S-adenosyl-L-methionine-dependent methyltransferase [Corynespora cassiicola Philippines]|uniref:S-adenosyl-L-methionine-dependent methyltransferase n=1 Tax=Corynespora cassiicola Philippines TaxID=1448308 RepID=A0A2T2N280_CORCC|nr:S-adenosyl-L-methionine-dependent methyltransferase [Corynespora cassiicola Philippines]
MIPRPSLRSSHVYLRAREVAQRSYAASRISSPLHASSAAVAYQSSWSPSSSPSASPPPSFNPTSIRPLHTTSRLAMALPTVKNDWSATQYLKFGNERTRPVYDMFSQVMPHLSSKATPLKIYDLGCGPGNSTAVLSSAFPGATITGMDSSPDMLSKARAALPDLTFEHGDLATYQPAPDADLLFSNAVFHWLRSEQRLPTLKKLFAGLGTGAVVAVQVPDNYHAPSHTLMRETALQRGKKWTAYFEGAGVGVLGEKERPDLDPIEAAEVWYNALAPLAESVNVWRTEYYHPLADASAVVEWVRGTGLQPYLQRMGEDEEAKGEFLKEYERLIEGAYGGRREGGGVLLGYPRLFVVGVRK